MIQSDLKDGLSKRQTILWWVFAALLPLIYHVLYSFHGFEDKDTGFILGLCWQYISGAELYSDIIYIRPPGSILFHSLLFYLPDNWIVLGDRLLCFIQVWVYTFLSIRLLGKLLNIRNEAFLAYSVCLGFIVNMHNFPVMGWHTIDGVFFCALGIYALFNPRREYVAGGILGGIFLVFGALCKQSFYLVPVGAILAVVYLKRWKVAVSALVGAGLTVGGFFLYLHLHGTLQAYSQLTSGQTRFIDLFNIGIYSYIKSFDKLHLLIWPLVIPLFFFRRIKKEDQTRWRHHRVHRQSVPR